MTPRDKKQLLKELMVSLFVGFTFSIILNLLVATVSRSEEPKFFLIGRMLAGPGFEATVLVFPINVVAFGIIFGAAFYFLQRRLIDPR
jgi:hypothetical protein